MIKSRFAKVAVLSTLSFLGTSDAQMSMKGSVVEGRVLFHSATISTNGLACIQCHSDFDEARCADGKIRAGHSLYNAAKRVTWWGQEPSDPDRYLDIAHAAVVCVEHFMRNPDKLTAQQLLNLQFYLDSITRNPIHTPLALTPAADKTGQYEGFELGDHIRGRRIFHTACHTCHPNGNAGLAPVAIPRDQPEDYYARKIREGDGLGSVLSGVDPNAYDADSGQYMPFFGADLLDNQDIRDIIAFIKSLPARP